MNSPFSQPEPPPDLSGSLDLVQRAQVGEGDALDKLLARYQERLRRIVRIRLGARLRANVESMDIVQEAMMVAARKIDEVELRSSGAILNWLARIAEHKIHDAHDYFTANKRDKGRESPLRLEIGGESVGWDPPDRGPSPSHAAANSEVTAIVDDVLTELSDDRREVIILKHYCGAAWEDIASALGRTVPAAQELHRRAWENLREKARPRLKDWT